jgi:hypothetical protein
MNGRRMLMLRWCIPLLMQADTILQYGYAMFTLASLDHQVSC